MGGDHVRVDVFDDRIEVESPGRFPGVVDLSDPQRVPRFARNPRIARVLADLGIGQEFGEGLRRMLDEMRRAGLVDPVITQTSGNVRVVLSTDPVERHIEQTLGEGAQEIARLLREAGRLGTGELIAATRRSRPWVLAQLGSLSEAGIVERIGRVPSDPRAYWRLVVE